MKKYIILVLLIMIVLAGCKKKIESGAVKIQMSCVPGGFHAGYTDPSVQHDPVFVSGTTWETTFNAKKGDQIGFHFTTDNSDATETISVFYHDNEVYRETQTGDSMVSVVTMTISPLWD